MKKFLYIFILLFIVGWAQAQQRVVYTINDGWKFTKGSPFEAQLVRAVTTLLGRRSIYLIHGIIKMQTTKLRDFIGDRLGSGNNCL